MNPDTHLLYEYMEKLPFTVRMKVRLDAPVNATLLNESAQEAIVRFPYFSVRVGVSEEQSLTLDHNDMPLAVLPEKDERLVLGSDEVNGHLFAITYRDDCVWFNFSHAVCGAYGALFWVKATLYLYLCKLYGPIDAPEDIRLPKTAIPEDELAYPDESALPHDEPSSHYEGDSNVAIVRSLKYLFNPFAKDDNYYYQLEIPTAEFMGYVTKVGGTPNTVLTAAMFKMASRYFKEKKGTHLSGRIAADYRADLGASTSYRDFVRFIHVRYEWSMKNDSIEELSMVGRRAIAEQNEPALGRERFFKVNKVHRGIDEQPTLKKKKRFALSNSAFRSDPRDPWTVSYVGKIDWGGMQQHIKDVYTLSDGDLILEVNALDDHFNIAFQVFNMDERPLKLFCDVLNEEGIPYTASERLTRYLPKIQLP